MLYNGSQVTIKASRHGRSFIDELQIWVDDSELTEQSKPDPEPTKATLEPNPETIKTNVKRTPKTRPTGSSDS